MIGYAAAAIGNKIFYYGGYCSHDDCYHNSLHSFNVDTFHWEELSPTTPHHGPMMKRYCGMIAVQLDGEDYLVIIGGEGPSSNTPTQAGAQYSDTGYGRKSCNEIHYYKLSSCRSVYYDHQFIHNYYYDFNDYTSCDIHTLCGMCILICTVWGILCG